MTLIKDSLTNSAASVPEEDLLAPALLALYKAKEAGSPVTALGLVAQLQRLNAMSDADRKVAEGDRLNQFQRRVVNLVHNTLIREGYVRTPAGQAAQHASLTTPLGLTPRGERRLARQVMGSFGVLRDAPSRERGRALETELARPALFLLVKLGFDEASKAGRELPLPVPMTELRTRLRALAPKSSEDLAPLLNRSDSKIDQVIRNMISHNTLTSPGWARREGSSMRATNEGVRQVLSQLLAHIPLPPPSAIQNVTPQAPAPAPARRVRPR